MSTSIYETMGEEGYDIATSDLTCTYQNIEPSEPPIVNDVELGDNRVIAETVPALTNTEGFTVDTKNEFRFIIDSSNCTATG
ncbi:MAG: hypothetical protein MJ233_04760 [Mycoplasmoidaceae bacterium]|nr:hypothetical protein [Mycoplasmoidaceae bacterium]